MLDEAFWADRAQWIIWGIVMALVMGALARSRKKVRPPAEDNTLVHPKGILVAGVLCTGLFVACAVLSFDAKTGGPGVALTFLALALLGVPLIIDYSLARHTLTATGLDYGTMFKGRHSLRWADVTSVRYSQVSKWFLIESPGRPVARISAMLVGLEKFSAEVLRHVPHQRIEPQTLQILKDAAQGTLPTIWK